MAHECSWELLYPITPTKRIFNTWTKFRRYKSLIRFHLQLNLTHMRCLLYPLSHHQNTTSQYTTLHRKRNTQSHVNYYNIRFYYLDYSSHNPNFLIYIISSRTGSTLDQPHFYAWPTTNLKRKPLHVLNTNITPRKILYSEIIWHIYL